MKTSNDNSNSRQVRLTMHDTLMGLYDSRIQASPSAFSTSRESGRVTVRLDVCFWCYASKEKSLISF